MRVAVCLSGHMRTYKRTYESLFRALLEPNDADLFIATWDILGHGKHNTWDSETFQEKLDKDHVTEIYGPRIKKLSFFNFNEVKPKLHRCFYPGMVSMYWIIHQADKLRLNHERKYGAPYDVVVRCRPDHRFLENIEITDTTAIGKVVSVVATTPIYVNDQFAISNGEVMKIYSQLYDHLPHYYEVKDSYPIPEGSVKPFWPEQTLKMHLNNNGIDIARIPVKLELCRGPGDYPQSHL